MKLHRIILGVLAGLFVPSAAFAYKLEIAIGNVTEVTDLTQYITEMYNFLVGSVGIVATVMIMWGGMQWIFAAGSSEKINKARKAIIDAIIGLVLVMGSFLILNILNPELTYLTLPGVPDIAFEEQEATLTQCQTAEISCQTDEDCNGACGDDYQCLVFVNYQKRCISTKPNNPEGWLCATDENCLPPLTCVHTVSEVWGTCQDGGENSLCDPDDPDSCEEGYTCQSTGVVLQQGGLFWEDEIAYKCTAETGRGYGAICDDDPTACESPLVCRDTYNSLGGGREVICVYQSEEECDYYLSGDDQSIERADCKMTASCPETVLGVGSDCVGDAFCCTQDEIDDGRCNDDSLNQCVLPGSDDCETGSLVCDPSRAFCCDQAALNALACQEVNRGDCMLKSVEGEECNPGVPGYECNQEFICCTSDITGTGNCEVGVLNECVIPAKCPICGSTEFCCVQNYYGVSTCSSSTIDQCVPKLDAKSDCKANENCLSDDCVLFECKK